MRTLMAKIFLCFILIFPLLLSSDIKYRYSFEVKTDSHGKILLIIPYRMYFKVYSEFDLILHQESINKSRFSLDSINNSGYLSRTLGFSGRRLGIFTANPQGRNYITVSKNINNLFMAKENFYSKYVKTSIYFPYNFVRTKKTDSSFLRYSNGIQTQSRFSIPIEPKNPRIKIKTFFRIYEILADSLEFYNHSFLPEGSQDIDRLRVNDNWESKKLDFTNLLNNVLAKSARIMKYILPLKQEKPFLIKYHVSSRDTQYITISGEARPMISIWRNFKVVLFTREVKINLSKKLLIYDNFLADVRNPDGEGGYAKTSLKLIKNFKTIPTR
jgi:hypothetical protein